MAAPLVGRRVQIQNLASKPELNGTYGLATSFDDAKGRYNVKLQDGKDIALKPSSLTAADETRRGNNGMPGTGGMPGMGGMPGGGGRPGRGGPPKRQRPAKKKKGFGDL